MTNPTTQELRAALKPFADIGQILAHDDPERLYQLHAYNPDLLNGFTFKLKAFHEAYAALAATGDKP